MTNVDEYPGLPLFQQPKFLRGVFSILLVSFLMSIFELGFYMFIIEPQTKLAAQSIVGIVEKEAYNQTKQKLRQATPQEMYRWSLLALLLQNSPVESYMATSEVREAELIKDINTYAYLTGAVVLLVLLFLLIYVYDKLSLIQLRTKTETFGDNYKVAIFTAMITVGMLVSFQVLFYFFGNEFLYVGMLGNEELKYHFNNSLRKKLEMKTL